MKFGIYCEMQTPEGKSHSDMTWEILRQIEDADRLGFDVYSVIDHHFFPEFSISANPLALFAAAAQALVVPDSRALCRFPVSGFRPPC